MKITGNFRYKWKPSCADHKIDAIVMSQDEWDTKKGPWRMHCMYSGMAKGTSRTEAMLSSKKIKPVALAIVELCKSEGISQSCS